MDSADRARAFARMYVQLTSALQKEGVVEEVAREEARMAATTWLLDNQDEPVDGPCPLCGRK